jgi:glycosyltransferase involved in cell wall biosynthesis
MILCGGYSYVASWQALVWAQKNKVPFLVWSESNLHDMRRSHRPTEFLKKQFLERCSGFVVPGASALDYLKAQGIQDENVFTAPNAVDNDLFGSAADKARRNATSLRRELALPDRYFLFVGRLVREKGVFELLSAYANLEENLRGGVGLVFVGDGECRQKLEEQAISIPHGTIKFAGFAQREQLGAYYGLAEMLILPTYTDTWGMVVNEAMACGLPVIISRVAGCAADLVREDWNGILVVPRDVPSLEQAMRRLATDSSLCKRMGTHSAEHIRSYSPKVWSDSVASAMHVITERS